MIIRNKFLILGFHLANIILIIFYLYPGSILGHFLFGDSSIHPQITRNFLISSNHFYAFFVLSALGMFAYLNTKKTKILIIYLLFLSNILEIFHLIIPNRGFEWGDLFGNNLGLIFVIIIYKLKNKYV